MSILKDHIGHMEKEQLNSHQSELTSFFLTALDFRAQHCQVALGPALLVSVSRILPPCLYRSVRGSCFCPVLWRVLLYRLLGLKSVAAGDSVTVLCVCVSVCVCVFCVRYNESHIRTTTICNVSISHSEMSVHTYNNQIFAIKICTIGPLGNIVADNVDVSYALTYYSSDTQQQKEDTERC